MGWTGIKDYGFGGKNRTKEQDDEYRSRIKGVPKERRWTKERCTEELEDILDSLKRILLIEEKVERENPGKIKREVIRDLNTMMNRLLEFMRYLYPPTQTNVNLNIDMGIDKVLQRIKEMKKEELSIIDDERKTVIKNSEGDVL